MQYTVTKTAEHIIIHGHAYNRALVEKIIAQASQPWVENIVLDGFSGVGGVTEGFSRLKNYKVIACINHWDVAIGTHELNHPDCLHLQEDFRTADLAIIDYMVVEIRKNNPWVVFHAWFSLECTNFSNAKGGMARDPDSRTLAEHMDRYVIELNPDIIWIENVKEFLLWGPMIPKVVSVHKGKKKTQYVPQDADPMEFYNGLIEAGHILFCPLHIPKKSKKNKEQEPRIPGPWLIPCPYRKGEDFASWKEYICMLGYEAEHRIINCADQGVPQHRVRLIMQFNQPGVFANWPAKTHDKNGKNGLPKWNPVRPCLDLDDEGEDVLSFKTLKSGKVVPRIESAATIARLVAGCSRHVISGKADTFFAQAYSGDDLSKVPGIAQPSRAITGTGGNLYLTKAHLIDHYFGNGYTKPISEPAGVSGTKDGISLQTFQFLGTYHSTGDGSKIDNPSPAAMTKDKHPLISAQFIDMQYSQGQRNKSIDDVAGAVLGNPKHRVVDVEHLIMDTQFNNSAHTLDQPSRTQTANRKHYYLVNFQWFNEGARGIDSPANTLIARMDKAPNYLIVLETGELAIEVYDYDPPHYVELKKFMAENGIVRITMRMLNEKELLRIMTMPEDTKLSRSSTNNKKMIGNAVPSALVEQLAFAWNIGKTFKIVAA